LNDLLTYTANGVLIMLYALWSVKFAALGTILALFILQRYGSEQARTAGVSAGRYGRDEVPHWGRCGVSSSFWTSRLFAVGIWTVGALLAPTGIEGMWSLIMWSALLIALHAMAEERAALLFRHVWMMAVYGCGMVGLRLLIGDSVNLSQIGQMLHVSGDSALLLDTVRGSVLPVSGLFMWLLYPIGYLSVLLQRFQLIRGALSARGRPQEVITGMSHRGEARRDNPRPPISEDRW